MTNLETAGYVLGAGVALCVVAALLWAAFEIYELWASVRRKPQPLLPWQVGLVHGNSVYGVYNLTTGQWHRTEFHGRWMSHQYGRAQDMADLLNEGM